jgi:uncharacterized protein (TIGR03086 family)
MIDLGPAASRMAKLLASVDDAQLEAPTPCPDSTLGDLIDHVGTFATAFVAVARKVATGTPPPPPDAANLEPGWRARIAGDLETLVAAWRDPAAWEGMTAAGGIDLPGEIAGLVALDELVVHGWDVAVVSGQAYDPSIDDIEGAASFVTSFDPPRDGRLFGPIVPVPDDASPLDRLLGLTGRDPRWTPAGNA